MVNYDSSLFLRMKRNSIVGYKTSTLPVIGDPAGSNQPTNCKDTTGTTKPAHTRRKPEGQAQWGAVRNPPGHVEGEFQELRIILILKSSVNDECGGDNLSNKLISQDKACK